MTFNNAAIAFPAVTLTNSGSLVATAGGAISQAGAIVVPGTASFTAGSNTINLTTNGASNSFTGAITLSNSGANAVTLTNSIATVLAASTVGNNLTIVSGGALSQTGALVVPGTSSFSAGTNAINLTTNGTSNSFTGAITLSNSGANTVTLTNSIATVLAASTVGNNLTIVSGGAISQTGALVVPGTSSFSAGSNTINLTTNGTSNSFTGAITLSNSGANAVTLTNSIATSLAASTVGGNLTIISGGNISQTGALVVPGTSSFSAGAHAIDLTTNGASNSFTGAITLSNSGAFAVTLTNSIATVLAASTVGNNLTIVSGGNISQTGALVVPGTSSFSAGAHAIDLSTNGTSNNFTGAVSLSNSGAFAVTLTNSGALVVGTVNVGQALSLTAGGSITQTGVITATGGATTLAVTAAASDILLGSQANDFGTSAWVFGGTKSNIRDVSIRNINAGAVLPSFTGLTSLRNLTVTLIMRRLLSLH